MGGLLSVIYSVNFGFLLKYPFVLIVNFLFGNNNVFIVAANVFFKFVLY